MVYYMSGVGGSKVRKNRDYDCAVCNRGHEGHDPSGVVFSEERDFVARHDTGRFEEKMEAGYALCKSTVCHGLAAGVVSQGRKGEVVCETVLINLQQIVEWRSGVLAFELKSLVHGVSKFGTKRLCRA